jgi:hypothetical protein
MVIVLHLANFAILGVHPTQTNLVSLCHRSSQRVCADSHTTVTPRFPIHSCDIIALAPSRTTYCIQKIDSDHRLILTLNLGNSDPALC